MEPLQNMQLHIFIIPNHQFPPSTQLTIHVCKREVGGLVSCDLSYHLTEIKISLPQLLYGVVEPVVGLRERDL